MTNQKLFILNSHIENLIHLHQQTLIENKKLVELNQSLTVKIEDQKKSIHQLDDKLKAVKLANAITRVDDSESKIDLKNKINNYINEIDKCLLMLNR